MSEVLLSTVLPCTLIFIMLGMGMTLTIQDFSRLKEYPRAIVAGLGGQLIVLPIVGALLSVLWGLRPEFAIGMVILAACPGGTTSNIVSHLANGDRPLSISLTAINSCVVMFSIPFYVTLAVQYFSGGAPESVDIPVLQLMFSVFIYTLVPVVTGMFVRHYFPDFAVNIGPYYDRVAAVAFTLIVLLILWNGQGNLKTILPLVGGVTITLNVVMTLIGLLMAYLLAMKMRQAVTIAIEVGIQNTVLGMAVAAMLDGVNGLSGALMIVPPAVYGLIMYGPATVMIILGRRHGKTAAVSGAVELKQSL